MPGWQTCGSWAWKTCGDSWRRPPASRSTTRRGATLPSCSRTPVNWPRICATTSPASARTCGGSCERCDFDNTISKLDEAGLLFQVLERFRSLDLHPDVIDNPTMVTIFEELLRKFNEAIDENPGEHFTPRDVIHLMVDLMLASDEERIETRGAIRSVYDPSCRSGGMLIIAKEHILRGRPANGDMLRPAINPGAEIHLFGQEVRFPTTGMPTGALTTSSPIHLTGRTGNATRPR